MLGSDSRTLFSRYSLKCPSVHALTRLPHENDVNRPNGLTSTSARDLNAVEMIRTKGEIQSSESTVSTMWRNARAARALGFARPSRRR